MAKNDNLTDFLTDVADAIREKKGTTEKINPQNFSEEILRLSSFNGDMVTVDEAIFGFDNVRSIIVHDGVETISSLLGAAKLQSIYLPDSVKSIGNSCFKDCMALTNVNIPQGVQVIEPYTFAYCTSLPSIALPDSVKSIGSDAFYSCDKLYSFDIPEGVESIEDRTFAFCTSLTSITISNSVTRIGNSAFINCSSLTYVPLPANIDIIAGYAFQGCSGVKIYDFCKVDSVVSLENINAFNGMASDCKIVVPDFLYDEWIAATNWSSLASRIVKVSEYVE